MKLVKFIKHYSQTKPLSPEQIKRWKEEEWKIIRKFLDAMDSDLDYLDNKLKKNLCSIGKSINSIY